jgi:hypothetical protein
MLIKNFLLLVVSAQSLRVVKNLNGKTSVPDISPWCVPFPEKRVVMVSFSVSYFDFLTNWFVTSAQFLTDDDVVVVVAEDERAQSLITDQGTVERLGRPFAVMNNQSKFVSFDGQIPLNSMSFLKTRGDWGSNEYKSVTQAKPSHMLALLRGGCTVYWTDIDAVWTTGLWNVISSYGTHDLYVTDDSQFNDWHYKWNLCTCQMYIQPTDSIIRLYERWIDITKPDAMFDQGFFNQALRRDYVGDKEVDFVVMNRREFPPGCDPVTNETKVIHANWRTSSNAKKTYLQRHNVWFPLAQE